MIHSGRCFSKNVNSHGKNRHPWGPLRSVDGPKWTRTRDLGVLANKKKEKNIFIVLVTFLFYLFVPPVSDPTATLLALAYSMLPTTS